MNKKPIKYFLFIDVFWLISCQKDFELDTKNIDSQQNTTKSVKDFSPATIFEWNSFYLTLTKSADGYRPPVSARVLA